MTPDYMRHFASDLGVYLRHRFPDAAAKRWEKAAEATDNTPYEKRMAMHMTWLLDQVPKLVEENKEQELVWVLASVQTFLRMTGSLTHFPLLELAVLDDQLTFAQGA